MLMRDFVKKVDGRSSFLCCGWSPLQLFDEFRKRGGYHMDGPHFLSKTHTIEKIVMWTEEIPGRELPNYKTSEFCRTLADKISRKGKTSRRRRQQQKSIGIIPKFFLSYNTNKPSQTKRQNYYSLKSSMKH